MDLRQCCWCVTKTTSKFTHYYYFRERFVNDHRKRQSFTRLWVQFRSQWLRTSSAFPFQAISPWLVNSSSPFFRVSVCRKLVFWSSSLVCFILKRTTKIMQLPLHSWVRPVGRYFPRRNDGASSAHGVLDRAVLFEPLTASLIHLDE